MKQIGHALLHIDAYNEDYLITLPALHIEGLIYGSPFVELNKATYISSSSGFVAKIDYSGKGWLSGKKNSFTATLFPAGREKETLYSIDGQWTDGFTIRAGAGGSKKSSHTVLECYDAKAAPTTPLLVAPLELQDPLESHRAWQKVAAAIVKGDMDTTGIEKSRIENEQRELRRKELAEGREWERRYFARLDGADPVFDRLAKCIGERIECDRTGGVWRFKGLGAGGAGLQTQTQAQAQGGGGLGGLRP